MIFLNSSGSGGTLCHGLCRAPCALACVFNEAFCDNSVEPIIGAGSFFPSVFVCVEDDVCVEPIIGAESRFPCVALCVNVDDDVVPSAEDEVCVFVVGAANADFVNDCDGGLVERSTILEFLLLCVADDLCGDSVEREDAGTEDCFCEDAGIEDCFFCAGAVCIVPGILCNVDDVALCFWFS
jgi:hypothetical protein